MPGRKVGPEAGKGLVTKGQVVVSGIGEQAPGHHAVHLGNPGPDIRIQIVLAPTTHDQALIDIRRLRLLGLEIIEMHPGHHTLGDERRIGREGIADG